MESSRRPSVSEKDQILTKLYYDPQTGLSSAKNLYNLAKPYGYTQKYIKEWINKQETNQIFKTQKKHYLPIIGYGTDEYQMDVMFLEQYKKYNKGYIGLMTFINVTSRMGYAIPIKSKKAAEYTRAFDEFYQKVGHVTNITTDNEAAFIKIIKKYPEMTHWLVDVGDKTKMGLVERFNRTIRDKITKYMKTYKTFDWFDVIPKLLSNYNNTVHSTIKLKPAKVTNKDFGEIRTRIINKHEEGYEDYNSFNVGDRVRVLKDKSAFAKGTKTFSRGIYIIEDKQGLSFILKNPKGSILAKRYKNWQLQKVDEVETRPIQEEEPNVSVKKHQKEQSFKRAQRSYDIGNVDEEGVIQPENERMIPQEEVREIRPSNKKKLPRHLITRRR